MKVEVLSGGTDSGGAINSGGTLIIEHGGTDIATTISKNGTGIVFFGGAASGVTILSGGTEIVATGGTASIAAATSGIMLASGGNAEIILQGVTVSGGTLETAAGGQIDVSGAGNVLSGIHVRGSVTVEGGGTLTLSGGMLSAGAIVETASGGTAIVSGTLTNGGTLYASASGGLVQIASGTVVNGGIAEVGNGIVDIQGPSGEEVSFLAAGSGGLDLDDATAYIGKVVGFGGAGHANHSQFIDLTSATYVSGVVTESYHGNAKSGVLTVTSSGTVVATIDMTGNYSSGTSISPPAPAAAAPSSPIPRSTTAARSTAPTSRCSAATSRASPQAAGTVLWSRTGWKSSRRRHWSTPTHDDDGAQDYTSPLTRRLPVLALNGLRTMSAFRSLSGQ